MRLIFALAALVFMLVVMSGNAANARDYPWCAYYNWSTYNCGFVSFRQCLATISGVGGWCARNPRIYYSPQGAAASHKRTRAR